ncbi:TPA: hypothetical protein ACH3X1_005561 [Trebouxia sp. C0004]
MAAGATQGATSIEVYGFTAWITTGVAYGAFICWAYIPERCLQALGISYYPDKYWALAVPSWICVAVVAAYWAYESWNQALVPPLESLNNIQDVHSKSPANLGLPSIVQDCTDSVPPLADADTAIISRYMYSDCSLADFLEAGDSKCARKAMTKPVQNTADAVISIFRREDDKQHLFTKDTLDAAVLSLSAFYKSATHPYVIDKTKKCAKPILVLMLITLFVSQLLAVPIRAIALAVQMGTLGLVSSNVVSGFGQRWVSDAVASAPMVIMLVVRSFVRKPLYKCFIHMLREVNPQTARVIETTPRISNQNKKTKSVKVNERVDKTYQRMHYLTMNKNLGPRRAAILSLVALYSPVEPFVIKFVEVWRASRILAPEILDPYLSHTIPHQDRAAFLRQNEVTINAFLAPQVLLVSIPYVGPLIFVPMQGASAWLVDLLARQSATQSPRQPMQQMSGQGTPAIPAAAQYDGSKLSRNAASSNAAPTRPAAFYPGQETYISGQGNPQPAKGGFQPGHGHYQPSAGNYQDSVHSHKYS